MSKEIPPSDIELLIADEFGVNADYVISLFQQYKENPASIGEEWQDFFHDLSGNGSRPAPTATPGDGSVQTEPIRDWANVPPASTPQRAVGGEVQPGISGDGAPPRAATDQTTQTAVSSCGQLRFFISSRSAWPTDSPILRAEIPR